MLKKERTREITKIKEKMVCSWKKEISNETVNKREKTMPKSLIIKSITDFLIEQVQLSVRDNFVTCTEL